MTFKDLIAWQKARDLTCDVYRVTGEFPFSERFGLVSQMRRASVSVSANIAEGFGRKSFKEKLHFYNIAQGSLTELESHLLVSLELKFIEQQKSLKIHDQILEAQAILQGLVLSTKKHAISRAFSPTS